MTWQSIHHAALHSRLMAGFAGLEPRESWGEISYFYNPEQRFARGTYFLTIKERDGSNDRASALDREGVWRLNFALPKAQYEQLFGPPPPRPAKGGVVDGDWDFTALDRLMPHPIYGWMAWACILSPAAATVDRIWPLIASGYERAVTTASARQR